MKNFIIIVVICLLIFPALPAQQKGNTGDLQIGADRLVNDSMKLIDGKNVGIVTNNTGLLSNGTHIVDTLHSLQNVKVVALFGPEHGIRGKAPAGAKVESDVDQKTQIPVYSLYGKISKPTKEMLKNIDVLIYDIQDVGARFYTYISTLYYVLQAGAENNIPVIVLDRPNPINGVSVDGPVRADDQKSFVGIAPIPIMYGMTIGELAEFFVGEGYLGGNLKPDLTVVKLKNWNRDKHYDDFSIPWVKPSPNIPDINTAIVYPGTCLIEGVNVSEGRGTYHPFLTIGAPYINSKELINQIEKEGAAGVELSEINFTPVNIPTMAANPKYKGEECNGISIKITDRNKFEPVKFGIELVYALHKLYPEKLKFRDAGFDRLSGDSEVRKDILAGKTPDEIFAKWQPKLNKFLNIREKYLLY